MWEKYSGFRSILLLFAIITFLSGCDKELTEAEEQKALKKLSPQELELMQATNNLSLDILKTEFQQNDKDNFIFSPISVGMALGMVYNGVGEKEQFEIQRITGLESLVEKEINKSYNEIITFLQLNYDPTDVFCANSLWFSYGLDINESYRTKMMAYYDAEISEINFGKKTSIHSINNWGNLKTGGNGHLTSLIPPSNYSIYLLNAFGVNATWQNGTYFKNSMNFTNFNGEQVEVQSINLDQADIGISETDNFNFIDIPLHEHNFLFSIVQPSEDTDLKKLIEDYDYNELLHLSGNQNTIQANVSLPDVSFNSENNLKKILGNMGLSDIFQPSIDLSPSFITKNQSISEINQVARFKIKGQSTFGESMDFTNPDLKLIHIDRPFLYFVRDKQTKSVIFSGYYLAPEK